MSAPAGSQPRPWTVPALLAWSIAGVLLPLLVPDTATASWMSGFGLPLAVLIAVGGWTAKRWAFTLMLAMTLFIATIVLPATYYLESDPPDNFLLPIVFIGGQLLLLFHPATRSYATQRLVMSRPPAPAVIADEDKPEQVGVRKNTIVALIFLLTAIAIAGTLGVIRIYQMSGG